MTKIAVRFVLVCLMLLGVSAHALAQGGATSSIQGVVVDSSGAVIPGATVTVKNEATNSTYEVVTASNGSFTVPALSVGNYTVTVQLSGFKTFAAKGVRVSAGAPASVRATLEVGGLEQTVTVEASAAMVQTTSSSVSSTVDLKQISNLPLATRNALDFITFLPGIQTASTNRNSIVNGLPQSSINITVDGLSVQDNYLKSSDGFFARMSPRLDAVEEVTVTTAGNGADSSGQGATQIKFTTRSGSNRLAGSLYHYYQNDALNTNTYFNKRDNLPKPTITLNQYGGRLGGAVVIPGLYDGHDKAFFFVNYEEFRQPSTSTLNRTILTTQAQAGIFSYNTSSGVRTVNLMNFAGRTSTMDPTIAKLLSDIRNSTNGTGTITALTNPNQERFTWQTPLSSLNRYPTVRLDYNLAANHRLNGSFNFNDIVARPDGTNSRQPLFPGFPQTGDQISDRYTVGGSLRSTFGKNMVNEFRLGGTGGATQFSPGINVGMYDGPLANQKGFQLNLNGGISNASTGPTPSSREASTKVVENTLTWLKGAHSLSMGAGMTQVDLWLKNQTMAPSISFDVLNGDSMLSVFSATNFPGAATADITTARQVYAMLTGRVSAITATARIDESTGKYVYSGASTARGRQREFDFFFQDNWRIRPNLSLNLGVRYALQMPFYSTNSTYSNATLADAWGISGYVSGCDASNPTTATCNLFKAGTMPGTAPTLKNLGKGEKAYNTDWDNIAPSIGLNWTPSVEGGWLKKVLGNQGDTAFKAGFARAYNRNGIGDYSDVFGSNAGISIDASRNATLGNLGALPLLLNGGNLGAPTFAETPQYPLIPAITGSVNLFDPDIQVPYSDTWTAGIQRSLGSKMALDVRYVGTRSRDQWTVYNYNEANILDNGFITEFRNAMANLQANNAAGGSRAGSFKYFGAGTGTVPLPIYLAYFTGTPSSGAGVVTNYDKSTNWTSSNFVNALIKTNPNPFTPAGTSSTTGLDGDAARRANALAAGLPRNFFRANPDVFGGANVTGHGGYTSYNSMQMELRRRLSDGIQVSANYTFGRAYSSNRYSFRVPRETSRTAGALGDIQHAFKANYIWDLPFGQGRKFLNTAGPVLDRIVGGWNFSGNVRIQSGRLLDFGNVRMVGFNEKDLQKMYKIRKDANGKVWLLPEALINETVKAYSTSASSVNGYGSLGAPSGQYFAPANSADCLETISGAYGDCGVRTLIVAGPKLFNFDMSLTKQIRLVGRAVFEFRVDALNVFNNVYFTTVSGVGSTTADGFEVTGATSGRTVQLVSRITW
jgi:hypothetical protein